MNMKKQLAMLLLVLLALPAMAFDNDDYLKYVQKVKEEVWGKDLPQFNNRTVPARYKNESAVVMAFYEELTVDKGTSFNFLELGVTANNKAVHIRRYLVKINDKAALEKYSTFDIRSYEKSHNAGWWTDIHKSVLGVKVIKPDGTVKEVSNDEYKNDDEGKNGKDKRAKLAVPDLQVGDMIDYFIYDYDKLKEENIDPMLFLFGGKYPILDYQIHCAIDKHLCTQYRTMNGAPDFTASEKDGDIVLDARAKNLDKTFPDYAYNPIMQAPYTMLYVTADVTLEYMPKSAKKKGLQANPPAEVMQEDAWTPWAEYKLKWTLNKKFEKAVKEAKKLGSDEEKADYVYNFMVMKTLVFKRPYEKAFDFSNLFPYVLDKLKIPYSRALVTNSYNEPMDKLINYGNATRFIMLKSGKCYFPLENAISSDIIPSIYQNRDAISTGKPKKFQKGPFTRFRLALSKASDNVEKEEIDAAIDGTMLNIVRQTTLTGCEKEDVIPGLTTADELSKAWGKAYGYQSFVDELFLKPNEAKARAAERAEQDKKAVAENFAEEIKAYHDKAPVKINATTVNSCGENNKPFAYTTDYQMDGLVKKAGRNLVVSVGQLFGQQVHIEGRDRQRDTDVNYDYPSTLAITVRLDIPSDYVVSAESLRKLNNNVDNEAMSFNTKADVDNDKLIITFQKVYKQQRVPAAGWSQLLGVLDRAYEFTSRQIVLKKK